MLFRKHQLSQTSASARDAVGSLHTTTPQSPEALSDMPPRSATQGNDFCNTASAQQEHMIIHGGARPGVTILPTRCADSCHVRTVAHSYTLPATEAIPPEHTTNSNARWGLPRRHHVTSLVRRSFAAAGACFGAMLTPPLPSRPHTHHTNSSHTTCNQYVTLGFPPQRYLTALLLRPTSRYNIGRRDAAEGKW